jgi:mono/diheme cytochrome c family protein
MARASHFALAMKRSSASLILCSFMIALCLACSAKPKGHAADDEDDGNGEQENRADQGSQRDAGPSDDDGDQDPAPADGDDPKPSATVDAGGGRAPDAGSAQNVFTGTAAYVSKTGASTRQGGHNFAGNSPTTSPKGQACFSCHGPSAPTMVFGGTVYANVAGTKPAANVEVRVGTTSVYTDQDGNFYKLGASLTKASLTGARDATQVKAMTAKVTSGNCNSCHNGKTTDRLHVP